MLFHVPARYRTERYWIERFDVIPRLRVAFGISCDSQQ
jgi:hypothetical protein